jgi:hypothetical protein
MHSRVELIAAQAMQMQVPDQNRLHVVALTKVPVKTHPMPATVTPVKSLLTVPPTQGPK